MSDHTLLVCTVGGTPEAVAAAVLGCRPDRVVFVASPQTAVQVDEKVLPFLGDKGVALGAGQFDVITVADAQDFGTCVEKMRQLETEVRKWVERGEGYETVVDITGGTKCMAAALALVARRWRCRFSYVGGTERTKDSVGVVVSGKEQFFHTPNPWDSLGYQSVEDATAYFDAGNYEACIDGLTQALDRVKRPDVQEDMRSFRLLAEGYLAWDLFDHGTGGQRLQSVQKNAAHLRSLFTPRVVETMLVAVSKHIAFLSEFQRGQLGQHILTDLCANARRCSQRGRYDDAVARLYRAIEATAQVRLQDSHGIPKTSEVPLGRVPEPLRSKWASRAREGVLLLGLQEDFQLLDALGDELGRKFKEVRLDGKTSPLNARNGSILAHGLAPVGEKVFMSLWTRTLALAGITEEDLPVFPRLGPART